VDEVHVCPLVELERFRIAARVGVATPVRRVVHCTRAHMHVKTTRIDPETRVALEVLRALVQDVAPATLGRERLDPELIGVNACP